MSFTANNSRLRLLPALVQGHAGWLVLLAVLLGSLPPGAAAATTPLVQDWVRNTGIYSGRADQLRASTIDSAGNIYLVGTASSPTAGLNFETVKLNAAGQVQWVAEFDGPAHGDDTAQGIDVDTLGDVYVTGSSINSRGDTDLVVVHYTSNGAVSGNWANPPSGPGVGVRLFDGNAQSYDSGVVVKADSNGFVYVLGSTVGNGTFTDIVLMKFNQLGDLLWQKFYDGPAHSRDQPVFLRFTPSGQLLVGGNSSGFSGDSDWVLLLYDQNGNSVAQWADVGDGIGVRRYDFTSESDDIPTDAVFDTSGNTYVAGTVNAPEGTTDMALIRINADGTIVWQSHYDGPAAGTDQTAAMVRDPANGDLILAGTTGTVTTGQDIILLRYGTNGLPSSIWPDKGDGAGVRRYASAGVTEDQAVSLKIDDQGNLFVGGFVLDATTQYDFLIPVFSRYGELWGAGRYDGGTSQSERIIDLHVDNASHVIAIGTLFGNVGDDDLLAVRFGVKPLFDVVENYQVLLSGKPVTFAVTPPAGSFTYQWRRNGQDIALAQASSYALPAVSFGVAGEYSLSVTNIYGSTEFVVGELTVAGIAWNSGSGTTVSVAGKNGANITVDYSATLSSSITWSGLTSVTLGAGTSNLTDSAAANQSQRFYRVRRITP